MNLLAYRRAVARLTPAFGLGRCFHCRMPWGNGNRSGHVVNYTLTKGVFVTCEWCWPNTTPAERLQYAAALVFGTWPRSGVPIEDCHRDWPAIRYAFELADQAPDDTDPDAVQDMLDDATRAFADAGTSSERVEVIRDLLAGWYAAWPASAVTDEHEGIAHQLVALVYAAEARAAACPCLPGAPEHRHGVGGYSTDGEPGQHHHVIAFAGDGTWSLEHPTGCRTADADFDCPVRQLAERQITRELAELMSGWRFECAVSPLGDYFLLGDRLAEEQTEG